MKKLSTRKIVIIGGGYTAIWAYRSMVSRLKDEILSGEWEIVVIAPHENHVFHGWTGEAISRIIDYRNRLSNLNELMPLATHLRANVVKYNASTRIVQIQYLSGLTDEIQFDQLLVATGSFDKLLKDAEGEHTFYIKEPEQFLQTVLKVDELILEASGKSSTEACELLQFVVAGAGFTGVELAANLAEYLQFQLKQLPALKQVKPTISLVFSGDQILPELNPKYNRLVKYAEKSLAGYEIKLMPNTRLAQTVDGFAILSNGQSIPASMVISTVGQERVLLQSGKKLEADDRNRIITDDYLRVKNSENIWCGGDAAKVKRWKREDYCPSNALWAIKHGSTIGKNIARTIRGRKPVPFKYPGLGQTASFGLGKGIMEIYGIPATGLVAWIMRWFFFHYFLPSRKQLWACMNDWMKLVLNKSDRSLFKSPAKELMIQHNRSSKTEDRGLAFG